MELELMRTQLACYDTVLDTTVTHEETMEMIVPDACPDILRIADTAGTVCLKSKEAMDGRAVISGVARCAVLYLPDGERGVRRLEVNVPFSCTADHHAITPACAVVAVPRVLNADARALNPRKVLVRVNLAVDIRVYCPAAVALSRGADCGEKGGVEQLKEKHKAYMVVCVQEKPFTFSDDLAISGSRPEATEILKCRVTLTCTESKLIGNKLIFKGMAALRVCYRAHDCSVCAVDYELPFSQIMEISGVGEDADLSLSVILTDCSCNLADGRTVAVSLGLLAQAVVREERQMEVLTDLYSTTCDLTAETQSHTFHDLIERSSRRQSVREVVEAPMPGRMAIDAGLSLGAVTMNREGGRTVFTAEVSVGVLYLTEENEVYAISRKMNVPCPADLPEDCAVSCRCECPGEVFATPTAGGMEVRFDLDFRYRALTSKKVLAVGSVRQGEAIARSGEKDPSIVLRVVGQERLWDIAKTYRTTMADIIEANGLEDSMSLDGKLLLIPRKR